MGKFRYSKDLLARYPDVVGGVILAQDMTNGPSPESLLATYHAEQEAVKKRIGATPLSQIASLAAWRGALRKFGVDPTQIRSSAEALRTFSSSLVTLRFRGIHRPRSRKRTPKQRLSMRRSGSRR